MATVEFGTIDELAVKADADNRIVTEAPVSSDL